MNSKYKILVYFLFAIIVLLFLGGATIDLNTLLITGSVAALGILTVLPIKKEQPGYILNTLLVPLLTVAQHLLALGITDFKMIDKVWMIATQSKKGPFAILDIVGLNTAYNIALDSYKRTQSST